MAQDPLSADTRPGWWRRLRLAERDVVGAGAPRSSASSSASRRSIGTQVMVAVTGTNAFCGGACHSMQWVAQEYKRERARGQPHRRARRLPRLPHPAPLPRAALVQGEGRHQGRDRRDARRHLDRGEVQEGARCGWRSTCGRSTRPTTRANCRDCHEFTPDVLAKQKDFVQPMHQQFLGAARPASTATRASRTRRPKE